MLSFSLGILPGGCTAFIRCIPALEELAKSLEGDVKIGVMIVAKALSAPIRLIAENAGMEGSIVFQKVASMDVNGGYNAQTNEYVDMISSGILDPMKVGRLALESAASIASMLLTTEASIVEIPEEKSAASMPGGMDY